MGFWIPESIVPTGETVGYSAPGSVIRGRHASGGLITVTDQRLLFGPNRFEAMTGTAPLDVELSSIGDVRIAPPGWKLPQGRGAVAKKSPQVELDVGDDMLVLVVADQDAFVAAIGRTIADRAPEATTQESPHENRTSDENPTADD